MNAPQLPSGRRPPAPSGRANLVAWLRKAHGWIGLWGATLGLLFGFSGLWLNHRAVLKLEPAQERSNFELGVPQPGPVDAQTMAAWLQFTLALPQQATNVRVEPARPVAWTEHAARSHANAGRAPADTAADIAAAGAREAARERGRERDVDPQALPPAASAAASAAPVAAAASSAPASAVLMQPEHWTITFASPKFNVQADYWVGNRSVGVRRTDNGVVAMLTNLHKGVGMPVAWILLVDTLAGSLILLSLSGLALWMLTRRRRVVGLVIFGTALAVTAGLAIAHL